jgi:hypothetical protein
MKQKYGLDRLQYPIERYYLGLTSPTVPDRTTEYPTGASFYQGGTAQPNSTGTTTPGDPAQLNCTNPLFAPPLADGSTSLPNGSDMSPATLCNTAHPAVLGKSRGAGLVFFAHIGGVPHQLLQAQPGELDPVTMLPLCPATTAAADCPQKDTLATSDWTAILGNGAAQATATSGPSYDYSMIDPHMVESFITRDATIVPTGTAPLVASAALPTGGGADPINGREWITDTSTSTVVNGATVIAPVHQNLPVDREYACIFPLVDPTTGDPTPRDCSNPADFVNQEACDCSTQALSPAAPSQIPAVCGQCPGTAPNNCAMGGTDYNLQFYAKAYPTIREIELVHLMGGQGILSSLCPIHPSYAGGMTSDPVFGYRPAVTSIINRLKTALTGSCLPERLTPVAGSCPNDQNMTDECVQCLVLVNLSPMDPNQSCDQPAVGLTEPSAQVAANFALQQGDGGLTGKLCVVNQIPYQPLTATSSNTCKNSATPGWCYVTGPNAGSGCAATPQAIQFSANTPPNGSVVSLQCLEQSAVPDGG